MPWRAPRHSRGSLLLETIVGMVILAMVLVTLWPGRQLNGSAQSAVATADAYVRMNTLANAWAVKHLGLMMKNGPALTEMDASGLASDLGITGYDTSGLPRGMSLQFRAELQPAGCTGLACSVQWLIYSSGGSGFTPGQASEVVRALGASGASSTPENPSVLASWGARWTTANPLGGVPNVVAMRGAYAQTSVAQSIRVDGTSSLAEDWNVGQDAKLVATSDAAAVSLGAATGATLGATCPIPNAAGLASDGVTPVACIGGVWVITHAPEVDQTGTTTTVVGY